MKKFIDWLKNISKNALIQKFYLIAFIAFCVYLIVPKWQISHQGNNTVSVNKFTGEIRDKYFQDNNEMLQHRVVYLEQENERLAKRVNELVNFIKTAKFEKSPDGKFDFEHSVNIELEK